MDIAFNTLPIRRLCEDASHADIELGANAGISLRNRLKDLEAATSVLDLLAGNPRSLANNWLLDLTEGYVITFAANHPKNPMDNMGNIHWPKVTRVKIMDIKK